MSEHKFVSTVNTMVNISTSYMQRYLTMRQYHTIDLSTVSRY